MVKKTILEIYSLAVCFFTVACAVIALGMALWNMIQIIAPEFTIRSHDYKCHVSDEAYRRCFEQSHEYLRKDGPLPFPEGEALTNRRQQDYALLIHTERRDALQGIVQKTIIIFLDLLVFIVHWRLARWARTDST